MNQNTSAQSQAQQQFHSSKAFPIGNSINLDHITLRCATTEDAVFVDALMRMVTNDYVQQAWSSLAAREAYYLRKQLVLSTTKIVTLYSLNIGRLSLIETDQYVDIDNLHLLPSFQGKGIGRHLLEAVLQDCKQKGLYARLSVIKTNPAKRLYERLGFTVYNQTLAQFYMRCRPY